MIHGNRCYTLIYSIIQCWGIIQLILNILNKYRIIIIIRRNYIKKYITNIFRFRNIFIK